MNEKGMELYRSTLHPLLSISIPFLFLLTVVTFLRGIGLYRLISQPPAGSMLVVLAAGAAEAVSGNILSQRRASGNVARLREVVFVLIGAAVILLFLSGDPFRGKFNPFTPGIIPMLVFVGAQWIMSFFFHRTFITREAFLKRVVGKSGLDLQNAVRDSFDEAGSSAQSLVNAKKAIIGFQLVIFFFSFLVLIVSPTVSLYWSATIVAFEGLGIFFLAILNYFIKEQELFGDGISMTSAAGRKRIKGALASVLLLFVTAIVLSGRQSILPPSYLAMILDAINNWLSRRVAPPAPPMRMEAPASRAPDQMEWLRELQAKYGQGSEALATVMRILGIAVLAALAAGFLYFLIRPLLSRDTRKGIKDLHPLRLLTHRMRGLARSLRNVGRFMLSWLTSPRESFTRMTRTLSDGFRNVSERIRGTSVARERDEARARKRKLSRVIRGFVQLIRWGERVGIPFAKTMGPCSYAGQLRKAAPEKGDAIVSAAVLFEELVFSRHEADQGKISAYIRSIDEIVRYRPRMHPAGSESGSVTARR